MENCNSTSLCLEMALTPVNGVLQRTHFRWLLSSIYLVYNSQQDLIVVLTLIAHQLLTTIESINIME